ncbi:hypothetical protein Q604_UNBC17092G0001, partial [human gut metagenome]
MAFMNHKYQDYALDEVMEESPQTYQAYLSQLWQDLNGGSSIQSMSDLTKNPPYNLSCLDSLTSRHSTSMNIIKSELSLVYSLA